MKKMLALLRSNLLIIISAVAAAGSIAFLYMFVAGQRTQFQQSLQQRAAEQSSITSHIDRTVSIPSDDPNEPRQEINITVNEASVHELEQVFHRMNSGYESLVNQAMDFNRFGPADDQGRPMNPHVPMVEGLFPAEPSDTILFRSPRAYLAEFTRLYQLLQAGPPPTAEEITLRQNTARAEYLGLRPGITEQDPELVKRVAQAHLSLLMERARQIQIYGDPVVPSSQSPAQGMFHVEPWASSPTKPRMGQLWEAQMQLWIQQDIVQAIRIANATAGGGSVFDNPVKRVLSITLEPATYVGLSVAPATNPKEPAPPATSIDEPLPDNFDISPTGRLCNPLYDVRMAFVSVIVDSTRLPELMNALGQVNYMTPIITRIARVDQAQHIRLGYLYGDKVDVVQVDLQIETLWMRRWTAGHWNEAAAQEANESFDPGLMPDMVRYYLGLPVRSDGFNPATATGDVIPIGRSGDRPSAPTMYQEEEFMPEEGM